MEPRTKETILRDLKQFSLFSGLNDEQIELIYSKGELLTLQQGDVIVDEGQTDHNFHILLSGEMDIVLPKFNYDFERISEVKLGTKKPGDCVGEYSFIDGRPASASVIAKENCQAFMLDRHIFKDLLDTNDGLAKQVYLNMLKMLAGNIRHHDKQSDTFVLL